MNPTLTRQAGFSIASLSSQSLIQPQQPSLMSQVQPLLHGSTVLAGKVSILAWRGYDASAFAGAPLRRFTKC